MRQRVIGCDLIVMLSDWVHVNLAVELADAIQFCIALVLHSLKLFYKVIIVKRLCGIICNNKSRKNIFKGPNLFKFQLYSKIVLKTNKHTKNSFVKIARHS